MKISLGTVLGIVGAVVAVLSLGFTYLRDRDSTAEERGALRAIVTQLEKTAAEHRQLLDDTRSRLNAVERTGRFIHGELETPR